MYPDLRLTLVTDLCYQLENLFACAPHSTTLQPAHRYLQYFVCSIAHICSCLCSILLLVPIPVCCMLHFLSPRCKVPRHQDSFTSRQEEKSKRRPKRRSYISLEASSIIRIAQQHHHASPFQHSTHLDTQTNPCRPNWKRGVPR